MNKLEVSKQSNNEDKLPQTCSLRFTGSQAMRLGYVVAVVGMTCGAEDFWRGLVGPLAAGAFTAMVDWKFHEE